MTLNLNKRLKKSDDNCSAVEIKVYAKDSFDRFGDDLCELLISYLSFEDKFRFECLSKQIQRLVFNKVMTLDIESQRFTSLIECFNYQKRVNIPYFESVLNKCPKIRTLFSAEDIINEEEVFQSINKYCNHLNKIESDFDGLTDETIESFCSKFGPKLKRINFIHNNQIVKQIIKLCPNIEIIGYDWISLVDIFDDQRVLVNKLTRFSFYYFTEDVRRIVTFVNQNKKTLKSIEMIVYDQNLTTFHMKTLFDELSKLMNLKTIGIYYYISTDNSFVNYIQNLRQNSPKLSKVDFDLRINSSLDALKVFKSFNGFKELKSIKIRNYCEDIPIIPVLSQSLKDCNQLSDLTLIGNTFKITDEFFTSIDKNLPKLQNLYSNKVDISGQALEQLSKLLDLRSLTLISLSLHSLVDESEVLEFIEKSSKLQSICLLNSGISCDFIYSDIDLIRESIVSDTSEDFMLTQDISNSNTSEDMTSESDSTEETTSESDLNFTEF